MEGRFFSRPKDQSELRFDALLADGARGALRAGGGGLECPTDNRKESGGGRSGKSLGPAPARVDSLAKEIEDYKAARVRSVAYELGLPFRLKELREHAQRGVEKARGTYCAKSGQVEWLPHVKWHIFEAVAQGGIEEEAKAEKTLPEDERIREAVKTFSDTKEWNWTPLLEGCGYEEARALGVYLDGNRAELERSLGKKALQHVEVCALERRIAVGVEGAKFINISNPYWAAVFWRRAREENVSGVKPGPQDRHTVPERASYRRIAASLSPYGEKVTDKQVKTWLDRLREYPEIKAWLDRGGPEPEIEGDLNDFLLKIADPRAWRRKQRRVTKDNGE